MTDLRAWYRANGICVSCGQENAVQGQARCFRCREKVREANRRWYEKNREEHSKKSNQYHKERTASLRAQGYVPGAAGASLRQARRGAPCVTPEAAGNTPSGARMLFRGVCSATASIAAPAASPSTARSSARDA